MRAILFTNPPSTFERSALFLVLQRRVTKETQIQRFLLALSRHLSTQIHSMRLILLVAP